MRENRISDENRIDRYFAQETHKSEKVSEKIRPEIMDFAKAMEAKMCKHDKKRGDSWKQMDYNYLSERLVDEENELSSAEAEQDIDAMKEEIIDVANFLMMMRWKLK